MMTSRLSAGERRDARAWEGGRGGRCRQSQDRVLEGSTTILLQDRLQTVIRRRLKPARGP